MAPQKTPIIPVFFSVDDNYVPYLRIAISSLLSNGSKDVRYELYILYTSLSYESKRSLLAFKSKNVRVHFNNVTASLNSHSLKANVRDYYTMTTYYRLLLPDLYPNYQKVLYLDCDLVVTGDIAELYGYDLGKNFVGAVPDASVALIDEFGRYVDYCLGVKRSDYFNAGVLLMNLKEMRKHHFLRSVTKLLASFELKVAQDQDILNVLCKGKTLLLPKEWNVMPLGPVVEHPSIIHYNLIYKPWKQDNIRYEDRFFEYAEKLGLKEQILENRAIIPDEAKFREWSGVQTVIALCVYETRRANSYYRGLPSRRGEKAPVTEIAPYRQNTLDRINELERTAQFDQDVENDPPFVPLKPGVVDYERKKLSSKVKAKVADRYSFRYFNSLIKKGAIVIDAYEGTEILSSIQGGAILTANHFSPFDSVPIHKAVKRFGKRRTLYKIIKEGNYSYPGLYGFFMRNCYTLPLASNIDVMKDMLKAVKKILAQGEFLLVYAEQSMWWNYRKPKALKPGAYSLAVTNNVPIIPTFITMRDTDRLDGEGLPIQAYTLHILDPIYPKEGLSLRENVEWMQRENFRVWRKCYEEAYGIPLSYSLEEGKELPCSMR